MPQIARHGPYRFCFFSNNGGEPPHVHAMHDRKEAKFWLEPVALARNRRFNVRELHRIEAIVRTHRLRFLEIWHAFFTK